MPDETSRMCPTRAAMWGAQRDEMAHTTRAVQLLHVVASDQSALRVAHQIDAIAPVLATELLDPLGHDGGKLFDRPCVEAAEEPSEVDVVWAVSQPTESIRERADDARCSQEPVHEQHRSPAAVHP